MISPHTIDDLDRRSPLYLVIRQVFHGFLAQNCMHMAAAISYFSLLSMFPLALALISFLAFILRSDQASELQFAQQFGTFVPISQDLVVSTVRSVVEARGAASTLAIVGLIWTSMSVFAAVRKAVNAAWGINQPRMFLYDRLIDFGLMAGTAVVFIVSLMFSALLDLVRRASVLLYGETLAQGLVPWALLAQVIPPVLAFLCFATLYRVLPNARVTFRDVWLGALVATVGFEVTKRIFVMYASGFSNFNVVYGSLSALVALLLWVYVSALILLIGAAVSSVVHRIWGAGVPPEGDALLYVRP